MKEERFLFDEGVKEIMMTLFSMGAMAYEADYVAKQLEKRPEPVEQKVEALKRATKIKPNVTFDQAAEKLMKYYTDHKHILTPKKEEKNVITKPTVNLVDFVKKHESFLPRPKWDYKQYSIGYGTKAQPGDKEITEQEASNRLVKVLDHHKNVVTTAADKWGYKWTPNQINALTSFRFNIGSIGELTANGTRSNDEIAKKMLEYVNADGKPAKGLIKRRNEEQKLFLNKF